VPLQFIHKQINAQQIIITKIGVDSRVCQAISMAINEQINSFKEPDEKTLFVITLKYSFRHFLRCASQSHLKYMTREGQRSEAAFIWVIKLTTASST
jgi:hypothetical protein